MNAIEIEQAISELAELPFNKDEFPFQFLEAFGNKETTIRKLRTGNSNKSDLGGVLQTNNIHIVVCNEEVSDTLAKIKESPATRKGKVKFGLATDGNTLEAEDFNSGESIVCEFSDFADHFGFFLPLAGISTVKQIRENAFDIKATSRLNKLYVQLLDENPDWASSERREDMNHFMARLIFCFFAEDTSIFTGSDLFTQTVTQMSQGDSTQTHFVISEIFRSMNTKIEDRKSSDIPRWADQFPYVNGGLFAGETACPSFSKIARSYLLHVGSLDWTKINPDIFGSMIQAIADDEERGELGMHYTSVPNILKVLNPLFLDDLRSSLQDANNNPRKLLNLRKRISRIRVFDPACGSGNFLVIAYRELRAIENEINIKRGEPGKKTEIPITNFRGIEIRSFSAEIARLALLIAEFQCDEAFLGQKEALVEFLPLSSENWITCGNALQLDWLSVCPKETKDVRNRSDDLFGVPSNQSDVDFENEGGETYICGNPPYKGTKNQSKSEKSELSALFKPFTTRSGTLDYVCGWFLKASQFCSHGNAKFALVSTNSICQGGQVPVLWPILYHFGMDIDFACQSFKWSNLASNNAGVTVIVVGLGPKNSSKKRLFVPGIDGAQTEIQTSKIGPYLIPGSEVIVVGTTKSISGLAPMSLGNAPYDGGNLILDVDEFEQLELSQEEKQRWIRPLVGSAEVINGSHRFCLWIKDEDVEKAQKIDFIQSRIEKVRAMRLASSDSGTREMAKRSHQFREMNSSTKNTIVVPIRSSESREFLPANLMPSKFCVTNLAYAIYDGELSDFAIISSRMHIVWIASVCGRLETRLSYSNKMGWNTFPLPVLTEKNKTDLAKSGEEILLARESHFPLTIADLYDPKSMPENLRKAHEHNDEVLERIFVGRRFKNDTERLEKMFDLYTKMTVGKN